MLQSASMSEQVETRGSGTWPNFLIIGAHKAGTTSLHAYLGLHPEIQMSRRKELSFFAGPVSGATLVSRWHLGPDWYRANFPGSETRHGESSTSYTNFPIIKGVPQRIHAAIPEVKLIYLVREPIGRFVSHYMHVRGIGRERRSLAQVLNSPQLMSSAYTVRSLYWLQLRQYLDQFDANQILVISLEDLRSDRRAVLQKTFRFLDVDPKFVSPQWDQIHNASHRYPLLEIMGRFVSEPTVQEWSDKRRPFRRLLHSIERPQRPVPVVEDSLWEPLKAAFAEDADGLRDFTHEPFADWTL
jgi:hypothetical protein